jgi:hypothetical protein
VLARNCQRARTHGAISRPRLGPTGRASNGRH